MNEFQLRAFGEAFNPDVLMSQSPLRFDGKWNKGERGNNHPTSSGVFITLGDGEKLLYREQEQIAVEFLIANAGDLKELATRTEITNFTLGIQYHLRLDNTVGFSVSPSLQLMWHCTNIGIRPSYYISFDPLSSLEPRPA